MCPCPSKPARWSVASPTTQTAGSLGSTSSTQRRHGALRAPASGLGDRDAWHHMRHGMMSNGVVNGLLTDGPRVSFLYNLAGLLGSQACAPFR
jgi:hypothetical protein